MYKVTLESLMKRSLQVADLEGHEGFIEPPELIALINEAIAEWYGIVISTTYGGQYYRLTWPITTDGRASNLYPLAQNTADVISTDAYTGGLGNQPVNCIPYDELDRNLGNGLYQAYNPLGPLRYQVQGDMLSLRPSFPSGVPVTVNYTPTAPVLTDPSDVLNSWNGWESFIIYHVAARLALKDTQYDLVPILQQEREAQRARIQQVAANRDRTQAEPIHDHASQQRNAFGGFDPGWGGWGGW